MLEPYVSPNFCSQRSLTISKELAHVFTRRRTIREFSSECPAEEVIHNAIDIAGLAPSGANKQPWSFALVKSQDIKEDIRKLAEIEEQRFYIDKPNEKWINDLAHLHPKIEKEFLTQAPYLIVIFYRHFDLSENGEKSTNYYAKESVGIATGMLISALHLSGLSILTYTPKRMQFLGKLLNRPSHERPFMLLGVGLPADGVEVPVISKKSREEILTTHY